MQKKVLGQTEFSPSQLVSRETVTDLFETSRDFAGAIESQSIPYLVCYDDYNNVFYMLIPTTDGVSKVEFEYVDTDGVSRYEYYLGFADGLSNTSFDFYQGKKRFFNKEVDFYVQRVNSEIAA